MKLKLLNKKLIFTKSIIKLIFLLIIIYLLHDCYILLIMSL